MISFADVVRFSVELNAKLSVAFIKDRLGLEIGGSYQVTPTKTTTTRKSRTVVKALDATAKFEQAVQNWKNKNYFLRAANLVDKHVTQNLSEKDKKTYDNEREFLEKR